jgi:hypothetical protein
MFPYLQAQDTILTKEGRIITGKVTEVGVKQVLYVYHDSTRHVYKRNVLSIKYANGQMDEFPNTGIKPNGERFKFPYSDSILVINHDYFYKGNKYGQAKIKKFMLLSSNRNPEVTLQLNKSNKQRKNSTLALAIGGGLVGVGLGSLFAYVTVFVTSPPKPVLITMASTAAVGAMTMCTSFRFANREHRYTAKAAKVYNQKF